MTLEKLNGGKYFIDQLQDENKQLKAENDQLKTKLGHLRNDLKDALRRVSILMQVVRHYMPGR
jgi:regulator of replication initiation timing